MPEIEYAKTSDGVNIAFFSAGHGPPIVFASNIFGDAHMYRHLARHHVRGVTDRLSALGWRVIRYDVRGMGSWNVFTNVLGNIASTFDDVESGKEMASAMRQSTNADGLAAYYKASARIDVSDLLPAVVVPTLVIHEPAFPFGSIELCQNVAKNIRDARFVVVGDKSIAGTVHHGHVFAVDQFLRSWTAAGPPDARPPAAPVAPTVTGAPLTAR